MKNQLEHIAIIMDGNGRWARKRGLNRTEGHKEGVNVARNITQWCAKHGISYLSLYAFSTENWSRPKVEVEFLMKLLEKYIKTEFKTYMDNNIKFKTIGDVEVFSNPLKKEIKRLEESSRDNDALTQILALNYGSRDEIVRSVLKILGTKQTDSKKQIQELLEFNLDTQGIPDVDLLIRTGGEMRLSNFLLYQSAYAELHFSKTLFPDFSIDELECIINNYKRRNRRYGGL